MFTVSKVQLHVSAINVDHIQVIHEELINKLYQHVLVPSNSKRPIRNIVVFVTIYICTNNLFLLFDNTAGMTHLKKFTRSFSISNFSAGNKKLLVESEMKSCVEREFLL